MICAYIFFVNTWQKGRGLALQVLFLFGAPSICCANRRLRRGLFESRENPTKGFTAKPPFRAQNERGCIFSPVPDKPERALFAGSGFFTKIGGRLSRKSSLKRPAKRDGAVTGKKRRERHGTAGCRLPDRGLRLSGAPDATALPIPAGFCDGWPPPPRHPPIAGLPALRPAARQSGGGCC